MAHKVSKKGSIGKRLIINYGITVADLNCSGINCVRGFEKGLEDRGWREEVLSMPEIQASLLHLLSYSFLRRRWTQFWGTNFCCILGPVSRQPPLSSNPFSRRQKFIQYSQPDTKEYLNQRGT